MEEAGYLVLVLHGHQPFVRHPDIDHPTEENWLFETLTDCYLPLMQVCQELLDEGINPALTVSLSPPLCDMLSDDYRRSGYIRYLEERIDFLKLKGRGVGGVELDENLVHWYRRRYEACRQVVEENGSGNVIQRCRHFQERQAIDIIATAATHPYLPLWELHPDIVNLQIHLGMRQYAQDFGRSPTGFWLPECGYFRGADSYLRRWGADYFFLARHGLLNGAPTPSHGEYAPAQTPRGVRAFARDVPTDHQVAFKETGYRGDPTYADFESDIGLISQSPSVRDLTHQQEPATTGIRCCRAGWEPYDPDAAAARCQVHAEDFAKQCQRWAESLRASLGRKPVIVAMFDMEHFGHWWMEGPLWLKLAIRELARRPDSVKLVTAKEYLAMCPQCEVVEPSMSSWGFQGYSETWLMGRNHWIYPALYKATESFRSLAANGRQTNELQHAALNQYLRELLLAQASDWAFILHAETASEYATKRVRGHMANLDRIQTGLEQDSLDPQWLATLQNHNTIFADIDLLKCYKKCLAPEGRT